MRGVTKGVGGDPFGVVGRMEGGGLGEMGGSLGVWGPQWGRGGAGIWGSKRMKWAWVGGGGWRDGGMQGGPPGIAGWGGGPRGALGGSGYLRGGH